MGKGLEYRVGAFKNACRRAHIHAKPLQFDVAKEQAEDASHCTSASMLKCKHAQTELSVGQGCVTSSGFRILGTKPKALGRLSPLSKNLSSLAGTISGGAEALGYLDEVYKVSEIWA